MSSGNDTDRDLIRGDRRDAVSLHGGGIEKRPIALIERTDDEIRQRGRRTLRRARLGQEAGETASHAKRRQVHAFFEKFASCRFSALTLVRVRPRHRDGRAVHFREGATRHVADGHKAAGRVVARPSVYLDS